MTDIPDDILRTATRIVTEFFPIGHADRDACIKSFAGALLDERQRDRSDRPESAMSIARRIAKGGLP
ncbi:hypothetical protein [Mesorhizobium silamurunense]|uniref:hypothetical protein n=1 Tax=Mesorhizobium silamurunense TaxID=499528 RepID=UPI00177DEFE3|nr:hypothetical protein [Mesorhizobium silamurunense]